MRSFFRFAIPLVVMLVGLAFIPGSRVALADLGGGVVSFLIGVAQTPVSSSNPLPVSITSGGGGTVNQSNASSGVATSSNNLPTISYNYGFNGTTWDQLQVDGSKNLKVNCTVGCGGGSISNASSGVATSSTNVGSVSYLYGFNGTTWDQLVDAPANTAATTAQVALVVTLAPASNGLITPGPAAIANSIPTIPSSQYPGNATAPAAPVTATATGTTLATVATLAAVAGKTTYICGFTITADATALAVGTATVAGTISGSLSYLQGVSAVTSGAGNLTQSFNPCIPASAVNTAISVTSAAAGTGGNTIVNAQGYYL